MRNNNKTKLVVISQEFFEKMEDVFDTATNILMNEDLYMVVHDLQSEWDEYKREARKVEL